MSRGTMLLGVLLLSTARLPAFEELAPEQAWFEQARFGMFIHWGAYSLRGVEASWPLFSGQVPREEYEALPARFDPTQFDARAVARLAKRAGMKYLILTSKHHDGFAMFDTKLSDYSIAHAPYGRDICRMMMDAARAEGLRVGFYFSLCDWHHPDYMTAQPTGDPGPGLLPLELDPARWERFVRFMHGQVRDLCTNYGKLDVMWFDGGWERTAEQWKSEGLHAMIRELQSPILINNRGSGGFGDYATPEQTVPGRGMSGPWETCMTINGTWAYNPNDRNFKSADDLLTVLASTASGGGNLLLNVGPMPTGEIQPEFVERLEAMGRWLAVNGASIYGTDAGPPRMSPENRVTMAKRRLYVHLLAPPEDGKLVLHALRNEVLDAHLLSTKQALGVSRAGDEVTVDLSGLSGDLKHEVVVVRFSGDLDASEVFEAGADGVVSLAARDVTAHGRAVCYQEGYDDIGCWWELGDWVSWKVRVAREGDCDVVVNQGAPPGQGGTYVLYVGDQGVLATVTETTGWTDYREVTVGRVHLKPGVHELSLRPHALKAFALMNVKWVKLVPR